MQETAKRPGRPRTDRVIERDETIYQLIAGGIHSRGELAQASGHDRDAVHTSCKNLEKQGRIRKDLGAHGGPVWTVADGTPCP